MLPLFCSAVVTVEYGGLTNLNYVDALVPVVSDVSATTAASCAESCNSASAGCRGFVFVSSYFRCTLFIAGAPGAAPVSVDTIAGYYSAIQATNGIATLPQTKLANTLSVAAGPYTPEQCRTRCLANAGLLPGQNCYFAVFKLEIGANFGLCTLYYGGSGVTTAQSQSTYTTFIKANVNYTTL